MSVYTCNCCGKRVFMCDMCIGKLELDELKNHISKSEVSKLKLFTDVFNRMSGSKKNDVLEDDLIDELINTGKFTNRNEIIDFIRKAMQNGQIYERRLGFLNKA
jgi:hypothetical protein